MTLDGDTEKKTYDFINFGFFWFSYFEENTDAEVPQKYWNPFETIQNWLTNEEKKDNKKSN
jgi:hypothetical protein